jgi:CheY-like chemotaxis protein
MHTAAQTKNLVVYVEDDSDDQLLFKQSFSRYSSTYELSMFSDGEEALDYLLHLKDKQEVPCLIILDMNMPGLSAKELLPLIRGIERFEGIPIVVYTTSDHMHDQHYARRFGARFVTKPSDYKKVDSIIDEVIGFCKERVVKTESRKQKL